MFSGKETLFNMLAVIFCISLGSVLAMVSEAGKAGSCLVGLI